MRIEMTNSALRQENLFPNHFLPILTNYDPLSLLTSAKITKTTTPIPYLPPKYHNQNQIRPQTIHQFSFVEHNNAQNVHISPRPRPPQIILSSMHQPTQNPVKLFIPSPTYFQPGKKPQHNSHRKPFKLDGSNTGTWDIRFNISQELRNLLMLERIKLENISQTIGVKSKWVVTSSRLNHIKSQDDVFVGRANNPFGHSTKWKLRYVANTKKHENSSNLIICMNNSLE